MDILDDMGVSKLSAKVFSKVNYSFKMSECYCFRDKKFTPNGKLIRLEGK